ncbi:MAG: CynX/NimT family MFS transporter [Pseudomonadota bacterium]
MPASGNTQAADWRSTGRRAGVLVLLWVTGLYLRLPILVAPPLAPLLVGELELNQAQSGALTTIPVLMLALGAVPGAFVIARLGPLLTVVAAVLVLAVASAARALAPPVALLFVATAVLGVGVAVMQPALPVLVQRWCPGFMALGSAVYMNGMLMGEFIGAGLTLPWVLPLVDGSWRGALLAWSAPALLVAVLLPLGNRLAAARRRSGAETEGAGPGPGPVPWAPEWRDPRVWQLGVLLGAAAAGFFGTNAYMASVLAERGAGDTLAETLLVFNVTQVLGSLAMLGLARLLVGRRLPLILCAWGTLAGLAGAAFGGDAVFLPAVVLLGTSTCLQLILVVSLVPHIARERDAGALAGGMFAVGYLLGFVVPLAGGFAADWSGSARAALVPTVVLAAVAAAVALPGRMMQGDGSVHTTTRSE